MKFKGKVDLLTTSRSSKMAVIMVNCVLALGYQSTKLILDLLSELAANYKAIIRITRLFVASYARFVF